MAESDASKTYVVLNLEEQLSRFPSELLDRLCIESHLGEIVHDLDTETIVTLLANDLELSTVEVHDIESSWPEKSTAQQLELLKNLKAEKKSQITYK